MIQQIVRFDGGLSTKISPHLIQSNEGIVCENVNLEKGTLYPLSSLTQLSTPNDNVAGKHIYVQEDIVISNQAEADDRFYDTYGGRTYWTNDSYGTYGLVRYNDTDIGIEATAPSALSTTELSYILINESAAVEGFLTQGAAYVYAFTIVDTDGIESAPVFKDGVDPTASKNSMELKITHANLVTIQTNHPDMVGINVYRVGGDNPTFNLLIDELSETTPDVVDDLTNYLWYDKVADIDVSRIELYTFENTPPPEDLDMLLEINGTMWGSVGKKIHFARTGSPEYWGNLDYVQLDKDCTGLGKFGDSVIAFTRTSAYIITGSTRDDVSIDRLPFNQGCVQKHTVVNIDAYLVWTSLNGICIFNGSSIEVLTKKSISWDEFGRVGNLTYDDYGTDLTKWDSASGFDIQYAAGWQDKYYGVFNNGIVILDLSDGLKVSSIAVENVKSVAINSDDNLLYVVVLNADLTTYDVYYLSENETKMTATWKTGRLDDQTTDVIKHYRDVEFDGNPTTVEVFIDGISKKVYTGKSKFKLPAGSFGRDIQFEITTTEEIRSMKYEYSVKKA